MYDTQFIIFIICILILRLLPIFFGKGFLHRYSYDSGWYFLFSKYFHQRRKAGDNILKDKLLIYNNIENPSLYPYFLSLFLSFFSESSLKKFFNISLDILFIFSLYLILSHFEFSQLKIYLILGLYVLSPIFYSVTNIGPRLYAITPRLLSEILFTYLLCTYYAFEFLNMYFIILYLIIFSLILYVSKFTLQAIFLLLFPSLVLNNSYEVLFLSLLALSLNIYFSKTLRISMIGQYHHLRWYFSMIKDKLYLTNRNSLKLIIMSKNLKSLIRSIYKNNSFTSTIIKFLPFFVMLYYIDYSENIFFVNMLLVSLALFILINSKYLIFLGEAERYIVHAALPIFIVMGHTFSNHVLIYFLCFYSLIYVIELIYIYKTYKKDTFFDYDESYKYLESIEKPQNILLNPLNTLSGFELAARTHHNIFNSSVGFRKDLPNIKIILKEYPIINLKNLDFIIREYNIDLIILTKDYFESLPDDISKIIDNLLSINFISTNGQYRIYKKEVKY
tara:strand:+ start:15791 stop:17302 length:1512 start_codon:yes stop_codon:yes gene_type:complete